jgi:hypothetical protein
MQKLFKYEEYNEQYEKNRDLLESVSFDSKLAHDFHSYVKDSLVNESIFTKGGSDQLLNTLSKSLFGSLSKVSMIDQTIEKVYQLKAKLIDQEYMIDKESDKLQDKAKQLRVSGATPEMMRSIRKQRDAKENEFEAFKKRTNLEIERGMNLLNDIVGGNKRRQAYADSVISQAEVNLADYEYKKAKREGKTSEKEISKLLKNLEDKKMELKDDTKELEDLAKDAKEKGSMKVVKGNKTA